MDTQINRIYLSNLVLCKLRFCLGEESIPPPTLLQQHNSLLKEPIAQGVVRIRTWLLLFRCFPYFALAWRRRTRSIRGHSSPSRRGRSRYRTTISSLNCWIICLVCGCEYRTGLHNALQKPVAYLTVLTRAKALTFVHTLPNESRFSRGSEFVLEREKLLLAE